MPAAQDAQAGEMSDSEARLAWLAEVARQAYPVAPPSSVAAPLQVYNLSAHPGILNYYLSCSRRSTELLYAIKGRSTILITALGSWE